LGYGGDGGHQPPEFQSHGRTRRDRCKRVIHIEEAYQGTSDQIASPLGFQAKRTSVGRVFDIASPKMAIASLPVGYHRHMRNSINQTASMPVVRIDNGFGFLLFLSTKISVFLKLSMGAKKLSNNEKQQKKLMISKYLKFKINVSDDKKLSVF
jgi:hypothetical protein